MGDTKMMKKGSILPIAVMALAITAFLFVIAWAITPGLKWPWSTTSSKVSPIVVCTDDARLCPDGSFVGRRGPTCEFSPCPTTNGSTNRTVNTTTNVHALNNVNANTNATTSLHVTFINTKTHLPIRNSLATLYSDNGVRCVQAPCPTNGKTWTGKTNQIGQLTIPAADVNASMTFYLTSYQAAELHTSGKQQPDGSWTLSLTANK